jgi:predicted transcriptional regulator
VANVTIVVDDELLRRARIKAAESGTSVNEVCRQAIQQFAGVDREAQAEAFIATLRSLREEIARSPTSQGAGPLWPGRDALYEEMLAERSTGPGGPRPERKPRR